MKRIYLFLLTLFILAHVPVYGQDDTLPDPGITPDSPIYFLDTLGENFELLFAFGNEAKAQKAAEIAGEKVAELKAMAEQGKTEEAEIAADRYGIMVSTAAESLAAIAQSGEDVDAAVAEVVARATSIHLSVLADVYSKVPEQAKPAIERALQQSEMGANEALNNLGSSEERPDVEQIREKVQQKVEEMRQQRGIPQDLPDESENGGPPIDIPAGRP